MSVYEDDQPIINESTYTGFLEQLIGIINENTRNYDVKSIEDPFKIHILLLDTSIEGGRVFIEKISQSAYKRLRELNQKHFLNMIRSVHISSYPMDKVEEARQINGSPAIVNRVLMGNMEQSYTERVGADMQTERDPEKIEIRWNMNISPDGTISLDDTDFWSTFHFERKDIFYKFFKRIVDILGSLAGIILFAPLMIPIAVMIKINSRGPVLFRQERLGYLGRPFRFLKFRSMYINTDDAIHKEYVTKLIEGKTEEVNKGSAEKPMFKITNDPRITPVGRFIRKTSLDELPQFFNVLRGEMSLVGPRPPIPYEVKAYKNWHLRRVLDIKPGITGLWQAYGRSKTTFDEMVRLDLQYVNHCSPWLDFKIILKTIAAVFDRDGAY